MNYINLIYTPSEYDFMELEYIKKQEVLESEIIVLVPDQLAFEAEKYLVNKLNSRGLFNIQVYGLKKLVYELSYLVGLSRDSIISELGKKLALMQILKEEDKNLEIFKGAYSSDSFVEMIQSQLDALRLDSIDALSLNEMAKDLASTNINLSKKLLEFSIILEKYSDYFSDEAVDEIELIDRLKEYFIESKKRKTEGMIDFAIDSYVLIVDFFTGMSSLELGFITAMADRASDSFIRVLQAKSGVASRYSSKFIIQVENSYKSIRAQYVLQELGGKSNISESNAYAFASLFDYEDRDYFSHPKLDILKAKSKEDEIHFIAQDILKNVRENGFSWSDFAIISSASDEYEYTLSKIFNRYEIPYFRDESYSINSYNLVMLIIYCLKSISTNFKQTYVNACFKLFAFLEFDEEKMRKKYFMAAQIERYALKMNINYDRYFDENVWKYLNNNESEKTSEQELSEKTYKNMILGLLRDLKLKLNKSTLLVDKIYILSQFLESIGFFSILNKKIELAQAIENESDLKKYRGIRNAIDELGAQIELFSENMKMNLVEFSDFYISALSSYKLKQTPPSHETVIFGSIERTKFIKVRKTYVLAATDKNLPSCRAGGNQIFTNSEAEVLDKTNLGDFKTISKFMDKEIFDVYEKIIYSTEGFHFTYPKLDEAGEDNKISNWVKNLAKNYKLEIQDYQANLESIKEAGSKQLFYEKFLLKNPLINFDYSLFKGELKELEKYFLADNLFNKYICDNRDEYKKLHFYNSFSASDKVNIEKYKLSISKLEAQARCPFQYFSSYILRPEKNNFDTIDNALIGNVIHRAVENFVIGYMETQDRQNYKENAGKIIIEKLEESQVEESILELNIGMKRRFKLLEAGLNFVAISIISQLETRDDCKLKVFCEKAFKHSFFKDDKELMISGIVDRLDLFNYNDKPYARVVDYKSGNIEYDEKKLIAGIQIQLITYMQALLEGELKDEKTEVMGVFYNSLKERFLKGDAYENSDEKMSENYKLSGRCIDDVDVLRAVDKSLDELGVSKISGIKLTSKGEINKNGSTAISKEKLDDIFDICEANRWRLLDSILDADISISPYKLGSKSPCDFCDYKNICKIDKIKNRNLFRNL